jgi:hypothetical protein
VGAGPDRPGGPGTLAGWLARFDGVNGPVPEVLRWLLFEAAKTSARSRDPAITAAPA